MSRDIRCDICDTKISTWQSWFNTPKIKVCEGGYRRKDVCDQCWKLMEEVVRYLRTTNQFDVRLGCLYVKQKEDERYEAYREAMGRD